MERHCGRSIQDSGRGFHAKAQSGRREMMNAKHSFPPLRLCVKHFLAVLLAVTPAVYSQSSRRDLVAIRWPDLTNLEYGVREQIKGLETSVVIAARNPALAPSGLGEEYGKLGQIYHA